LLRDVELASLSEKPIKNGLELTPSHIRIALGVNAGGNIGPLAGKQSLVGHIYFKRKTRKPELVEVVETSCEKLEEFANSSSEVSYNRNKFIKGIRKAFKIGRFFSKRIKKKVKNLPHWGIWKVKMGFTASAKGDFSVATVGSSATGELEYYNMNF